MDSPNVSAPAKQRRVSGGMLAVVAIVLLTIVSALWAAFARAGDKLHQRSGVFALAACFPPDGFRFSTALPVMQQGMLAHAQFDYPASDPEAVRAIGERQTPLSRSERRRIEAMAKRAMKQGR